MKILILFLFMLSIVRGQTTDTLFHTRYTGEWNIKNVRCQGDTLCFTQVEKDSTNRFMFMSWKKARGQVGFYVTDEERFKNVWGSQYDTSYTLNDVYYVVSHVDIYYSIGKWKDGVMIYAFIEDRFLPEFEKVLHDGVLSSIGIQSKSTSFVNKSFYLRYHDILGRKLY